MKQTEITRNYEYYLHIKKQGFSNVCGISSVLQQGIKELSNNFLNEERNSSASIAVKNEIASAWKVIRPNDKWNDDDDSFSNFWEVTLHFLYMTEKIREKTPINKKVIPLKEDDSVVPVPEEGEPVSEKDPVYSYVIEIEPDDSYLCMCGSQVRFLLQEYGHLTFWCERCLYAEADREAMYEKKRRERMQERKEGK